VGAGDRLRAGRRAQPPEPDADPFSLGDADATARILNGAGFGQLADRRSTMRLSGPHRADGAPM
jgi:hypothetical protein